MISLGNLTGFRSQLGDSCLGKKKYPSGPAHDVFKYARETIETLIRNNAHRPEQGKLEPYRCRHGHIHIGHVRER